MLIRLMTSILLIATLTMATLGHAPAKQNDTPDQAQQKELTPAEEREARALAKEFITRLEKSGDVAQLVEDLYISDFAERFRDDITELFPLTASPEVAAQMSTDEILRAHTASINLMYMASRLYIEITTKRDQKRVQRGITAKQDEDHEPTLDEIIAVIPPNIIKLIQSDPALALLLEEVKREARKERQENETNPSIENSSTSNPDYDTTPQADESFEHMFPFKSLDQIRHYTSLAEQCVAMLRGHFDSLPTELRPSVSEYMSRLDKTSPDKDALERVDTINPRVHYQGDPFMGFSAGTRIICADALFFHVDMVRTADGNLKILNVHFIMD